MKKYLLFVFTILSAISSNAQNLLLIPDTLAGTVFNLNVFDTSRVFYQNTVTQTFGVNASYLGPTLFFNEGDSVVINVHNQLMDTTTIHWHGLHVSPKNDGGPHIIIPPGTVWSPSFKVRNDAATYWYHPHLHMMTNLHASLGAAGMIIVRSAAEKALSLPRKYGVDDFPLVIQSKCFDANKQIVIENASDSVVMVNGTLKPYLPVPAQIVRFRLLNASSERVYNIGLQGNISFYQIATDGGLLNAPVSLTRLRIAPGERAEILVDLNGRQGQNINIMSFASELPNAIYGALQPGMGPGQTIPGYSTNPLNGADFPIMNLQVVGQTSSPVTAVPLFLITNSPWPVASADTTRTLTFSPVTMGPTAIQGPFLINNASFDMEVVNYSIPKDNIEVWALTNSSPIAHPFHIHDVQFYITEINGSAPPANMTGKKDVVLVPAQQTVKFITKFETFCDSMGMYMYHCHMLTHEDGGMMGQFNVICPPSTTGIAGNADAAKFAVYPNPATGSITIAADKNERIRSLVITDHIGKIVLTKEDLDADKVLLDLDGYSSGIYSAMIRTNNGVVIKRVSISK